VFGDSELPNKAEKRSAFRHRKAAGHALGHVDKSSRPVRPMAECAALFRPRRATITAIAAKPELLRLSILSVQQHACGRRNANAWRHDEPTHDGPIGGNIAGNQDTVLST